MNLYLLRLKRMDITIQITQSQQCLGNKNHPNRSHAWETRTITIGCFFSFISIPIHYTFLKHNNHSADQILTRAEETEKQQALHTPHYRKPKPNSIYEPIILNQACFYSNVSIYYFLKLKQVYSVSSSVIHTDPIETGL